MNRFMDLYSRPMVLAGFIAISWSGPGFAQIAARPPATVQASMPSTTGQIADIVVTARKRAESLQDVPASVSAVSSTDLRAAHVTRVDDLGNLIPNLNITVRADNTPDVTIRGIGAFGVTEGVGFYANDVQLFEGQTVRTEDLERIEVLKGPQGTLYGGNNIGGAIKFITKKPTAALSFEATAEIGDRNTRNFSGAISGPIIGDSLKGRVSAYSAANDGFVYDPTLMQVLGHSNQRGGRLTLSYDKRDTHILFFLYGARDRSSNENLYYGAADDHSYLRETTANVAPSYKRELYAPSIQIEQDLGGAAKLTSISSYFHSEVETRADGDHRAAPLFDVRQAFQKDIWSEELRLASLRDGPFTWLVGGFIQHRLSQNREVNTQMLSIITDDPADDRLVFSSGHGVQKEYSGFADASYKFGDLTLEAGLRLERFENELTDTIGLVTKRVNGTELLPKFSLSYKIDNTNMVYTSVSRGLQPGDALQAHNLVSTFDSEKTTNYELGVKTVNFNRVLLFNISTFFIKYDNRLFNTIDGSSLEEVTRNVGPSHNYGVEAEFVLKPSHTITFSGGFGITRAVWDDIPGYFNPNTGKTINLKGMTAPFAPAYQGTLVAEWTHQFNENVGLSLHIDGSFHGKQYWNISDDYKQSAYQLMNLGARVKFSHYELSANLKNVFDTKYHTIFAGGPDIGSPVNTAGFSLPRQWFVSLRAMF